MSQKILPMTRREISTGLAFAEEHDLQRLVRWAAEGWRLAQIRGLYMVLEQAPPEQCVFAIDYQATPDPEYFEVCATAGWTHVLSIEQHVHLFRASPGTLSIFSANDAIVKYERAARMFAKPALWSSIVLLLSICVVLLSGQEWLAASVGRGVLTPIEWVGLLMVMLAGTIWVFTALPWSAYRLRASGYALQWSRLAYIVVFAVCGACIGYLVGAQVAGAGW